MAGSAAKRTANGTMKSHYETTAKNSHAACQDLVRNCANVPAPPDKNAAKAKTRNH